MWRAYRLKEALRAIFAGDLDDTEAGDLLDRWCSWAQRCRLAPFVKLARTIRAHRDGILAAIRLGLTNGRVEGLNNRVRLIVRRGFGFHTVDAAPRRKGRGRTTGSALSRNSLIKLRSSLSQALTWAQRRDLIARNVASLAELPATGTTERIGKSLTIDQARRLLAAADGTNLEAMWILMLFLGLRPGEAAGLSWNDIDFNSATIHIWRARVTDRDGSVTIGDTKTVGSIRTLEAPPIVLDALAHHRGQQVEHAAELGSAWSNDAGLVFTSRAGKPADPKAVRNEFERVITAAGIGGHWTPNLLSHTAASLMADAGLPIEQVADQLGHSDLRMLQKHYRHRIKPTIGGAHVLSGVLEQDRAPGE